MATRSNYKSPPVMKDGLSYEDWKSDVEIWSDVTDLDAKKQGGAVFLTLEGKAQATVRAGVTREELKSDTGLEKILGCLDGLYKEDATRSAFSAYEHFTEFRRGPDMSIEDYTIEFNIRYSRIKSLKMELPEGVLAYYLLKCANLTEEQQNICRATCDKLTFEEMKEKIERVTTGVKKFRNELQYYGEQYPENQYHQSESEYQQEFVDHEDADEDLANVPEYTECEEQAYYIPTRGAPPSYRQSNSAPRMNAPDEYGNPTRCGFCKSIYHYIGACPDAKMMKKKSNSGNGNSRRGGYRNRFPRSTQRGGFASKQSNSQYI